jgi:hypothetical protein
LHTNLDIAALEGIDESDLFEPEMHDSTAAWNCACHSAQLAVMDVLGDDGDNSVKPLIDRTRKIVVAFNQSPVKAYKLKMVQVEAKRNVLAVVRDVKTRWLSVYYMLERFVLIYPDILTLTLRGDLNPDRAAARDDEREINDFITPDEVKVLRRYVNVLRPLAEFVNDVEGEKYVTLCAIPVLYLRCLRALGVDATDDAATAALKSRLHDKFDERLGFIVKKPNLALAAAALSPAFGHLTFVSASVRTAVDKTLVEWGVEFEAPTTADTVQIDIDEETQKTVITGTLKSLRKYFINNAPPRSQGDPLHIPDVEEAPKYDVLAFWRQGGGALSHIYHLARLVLCVPGSSASSERVFSSAGFIVDKHRSRLDEENVVMLTTVRDFLKRMSDKECDAFFDRCAARLREAAK